MHSISVRLFIILPSNSEFFFADLYFSKYYMYIEKYLRKKVEYFILFAFID